MDYIGPCAKCQRTGAVRKIGVRLLVSYFLNFLLGKMGTK